jgi:hypothetical protein
MFTQFMPYVEMVKKYNPTLVKIAEVQVVSCTVCHMTTHGFRAFVKIDESDNGIYCSGCKSEVDQMAPALESDGYFDRRV